MDQSEWNEFCTKVKESGELPNMIMSLLTQAAPELMGEDTYAYPAESHGTRIFLNKQKDRLQTLLSQHLGRTVTLEFYLREDRKRRNQDDEPLLTYQPTVDDMAAKAGLNRKYTFDNFAVSSTNQVAFAAAQSVAKNPGLSYNPLFLYGGVGNGKTHLAQAAARAILSDDNSKRIVFAPGDMFINELIDAIKEKNTAKFRKKYRGVSVLIIDDIQFIAGKQTIQEEFFHTFNSVVSVGGQVILTSDRPPHEIAKLEDRLRSRFSGGLLVDIQAPDFELRTAILLIKAQEKNIMIDIDAAKVIAERITDTRALEGSLLSIYAKTIASGDTISLEDAEAHFTGEQIQTARKVLPQDVIKTVCSYYDIKQSHIKSPTRASSIALPRQIIMYILRTELRINLEEIAFMLKRKDHTTIMHGVEKITREMMRDPVIKQDVDRIIQTVRSST